MTHQLENIGQNADDKQAILNPMLELSPDETERLATAMQMTHHAVNVQERRRRQFAILLANILMASHHGAIGVAIPSRREAFTRIHNLSGRAAVEIKTELEANDWIKRTVEHQPPQNGYSGTWAVYAATPKLAATAKELGVVLPHRPLVKLRRQRIKPKEPMTDAANIPLPEDSLTVEQTKRILGEYLELMRTVEIKTMAPDEGQNTYRLDNICRTFTNGGLEFGGRLYANLTNMKRAERATIRFDGEETAILDFTAIHICILCARPELLIDDDDDLMPYVPFSLIDSDGGADPYAGILVADHEEIHDGAWHRKAVKNAINIMINYPRQAHEAKYIPGIASAWRGDYIKKDSLYWLAAAEAVADKGERRKEQSPYYVTHGQIVQLFEDIADKFPPLTVMADPIRFHRNPRATDLLDNIGLRVQRVESDIALSVVAQLTGSRVPCIPIHDGFLTAKSAQNETVNAMMGAMSHHLRPHARGPHLVDIVGADHNLYLKAD